MNSEVSVHSPLALLLWACVEAEHRVEHMVEELEVDRGRKEGLGSQYSHQAMLFHQAPPLKGSAAFQYCHELETKTSTYGSRGCSRAKPYTGLPAPFLQSTFHSSH